ncbi:MAG: MiaB/RimO family radical SAM methylthiotransferase [Deltaproteobacteria bacterium]|jgi:MiaB/RimO family radical SAM methylthiotransferase|nr:MiaB/RimO family radical SAM methylthiotransferase [Deltaproteobacteria bacterium]
MSPRRYLIVTFGCQMNVYDSGRLAALLERRGWERAGSKGEADFIFLNTCSIREKAVQRVLARLRELSPLKKSRPWLIVAVGGCAAEQEGLELVRRAPIVDIVAGPRRLSEIPDVLDSFVPGDPPVVMEGDPPEEGSIPVLPPPLEDGGPDASGDSLEPSPGFRAPPSAEASPPVGGPDAVTGCDPEAVIAADTACCGLGAGPAAVRVSGSGGPVVAEVPEAASAASPEAASATFPGVAVDVPRAAAGQRQVASGPKALRRRGARGPLILPLVEAAGPAPLSAFITVMEGCDNFCAYCVVPGLRGPERSRPMADVLAEARSVVSRGARELTLLGQNVNSYRSSAGVRAAGGGFAGDGGAGGISGDIIGSPDENGGGGGLDFVRLLVETAGIPGLWRLRFTTSHPKDFPPELAALFGTLPELSPHIHLPLQSGSDHVLGLMGRRYTAEGYMRILKGIREARPDAAVTTDVIVGFPGETEADFRETLRILEEASFDSIFSFKYSDRSGTRALAMPGKIPEGVKAGRLTEVIGLQRGISLRINRQLEGSVQEVLVSGRGREPGQISGRTGTFKIVNFPGSADLIGALVPVRITGSGPVSLRGEQIGGLASSRLVG